MEFIPNNGINHFNNDDIIVATVSNKMNNFNIEFKMDHGTKWEIKPASLKMTTSHSVNSSTEMAIMSLGNSNIKYEKGYYDILVNYSIDGNTSNTNQIKSRILVK
jgi:hypothetical protein